MGKPLSSELLKGKHMTLRKKTLFIISGMFLCIIVIVFFISRGILLENFAKLEENATHQNVDRALSALHVELDSLESTTTDWSSWDDTYAFIEDANTKYIRTNLVDGTFIELELNLMMFINSSGQVVFSRAFDLQNEEEVPISEGLQEHISPNDLLLNHPDTESDIAGIVLLPEGPMLVASCPILTSEDEGPVRGTVIMGRYLDENLLQWLAEKTSLSLTMYEVSDSQMPSDFRTVNSSLSGDVPILIRPLDKQSIAGYALLQDIYGSLGLILRTDMPRDIYKQGQATVNYLILVLVALGLVCVVVLLFLLQKTVLSRMTRLSSSVTSIGTSGDLSTRVSMPGKDELSSLADTINGMLAALQDSREKLKANEEQYRQLFDGINDEVTVIDRNWRFTECNEIALKRLGYSREEFLRLKLTDILHPDYHPAMRDGTERVWTGESIVAEAAERCKDGRVIPVEINAHRIEYQGGLAILAVARDITDRKRMEKEIRVFSDAVAGAIDVIAITDMKGIITYANPAMEETYGYKKGEMLGKSVITLNSNPEMANEIMSAMIKIGSWHGEIETIKKNGETFPALLSLSTIRDEKDNPIAMMGAVRDITERKQAEKKLQELYNGETRLRQELETEMRRRVEFTRALVHELKTPLTPVLTSSDMLTTELKQEPLLSLAKNISRGAVRLNSRIDELLDLARGEIGTLRLAFTRVEPSQLLRDVVDEIALAASRRKQSLELELPASLSPVRGDEERLRQIVVNLLNNACKFTPEGGKITVRAKESDAFLTVEVQDTGLGLSDEDQQRLFQPYYRSEDDRQRLSGLGLGLALCKTLVELHSGKIWVQSRVGEGSTFGFSVPLETTEPGRET